VERVKTGFWSLSPDKISQLFFYLLVLFLPTQLGKHFWPNWSFVYGLRLDYLSPTIYVTDILILSIFVFYFPRLFDSLRKTPKKYLFTFALLALFLLAGLSGAKDFWAGAYGIIKLLEFIFLAFFVGKNYKYFNKTILFFCVFASIVFETLLVILQSLNQGSIGGLFYLFGERAFNSVTPGIANASINGQLFLRPYATFSHPNVLAGFLVLSMLFLFLFFHQKSNFKILMFLGIALGTIALLLTLGRTASLFWLVCLSILFGLSLVEKYKKRKFNSRRLLLFIVFAAATIVFVILQNNFIVQRFITTTLSDESVVQRQELITQSLNMFWRHPIFGVGLNNFYNNLNVTILKGNNFLIQPVHNIFLLVLSETGIIGFLAFIFLLVKSFFAILKKQNKYLLLSLLAIIFLGMFDHYFLTLQQGQLLFALVLGITLSNS
jgi:O-antigen ligase